MDPLTGESRIVAYEETPMEDKLIDYSGRWWPTDAMVWVDRRMTKTPPESFSSVKPMYDDRRLISSYKELNGRI